MRGQLISLLLLIFIIQFIIPVNASDGIIYKETIDSYARINGETLRWESSREFVLRDYKFSETVIDNETVSFVEMEILYDTQRGQIETVIEPMKPANFELLARFLPNGSVLEYTWDMFLFRDNDHPSVIGDPFDDNVRSNFTIAGHRRFDRVSSSKFLSVNLEYFEFQTINYVVKKLRVNTELSANNVDNGRTKKTSIHMIKRDGDTILFEYNWNIQEVSILYRYLNLLDQPYLLVPYQIGAVFLLIFVYERFRRYWKRNFKIERITKTDEVDKSDDKPKEEDPNGEN
jgi:hypothetical protein